MKCSIRNEKGSHCNPNKDEKLKEPEPGKQSQHHHQYSRQNKIASQLVYCEYIPLIQDSTNIYLLDTI